MSAIIVVLWHGQYPQRNSCLHGMFNLLILLTNIFNQFIFLSMKRKSIYLAAALAALTMASCSNDEVMNDVPANGEGSAIAFTTTLDKAPVTRANTISGSNLSSFRVVCYDDLNAHYFGPTTVTKNSSNQWIPATVHNWKHKNKALRFFAVTGTANSAFKEPTQTEIEANGGNIYPFIKNFEVHAGYAMDKNGNYTGIDGSPINQLHPQHDVCAAFYEGKESDQNVKLNFQHLLSKIDIQAKNDKHDQNRTVEVMGARLVNLTKEGTWVYNIGDVPSGTAHNKFDGTWTHVTSGGDFCIRLHTKEKPDTLNSVYKSVLPKDESFMVLPTVESEQEQGTAKWVKDTAENGTYLSVICRVTTTDQEGNKHVIVPNTGNADKYGMAMIPISFKLLQGKKYTFRLDFSNGSGQIDPTTPGTPGDEDIDGPKDPDHSGDDYEGGQIQFDVTVDEWATGGNIDEIM